MSATTRVAAWQCHALVPRRRGQPAPARRDLRVRRRAAGRGAGNTGNVHVRLRHHPRRRAAPRRGGGRADRGRRRPDRAAPSPRDRLRAPGSAAPAQDGASKDRAYNAATMIGPDGVVRGRHRKVHLFGNLDRSQFVANSEPARRVRLRRLPRRDADLLRRRVPRSRAQPGGRRGQGRVRADREHDRAARRSRRSSCGRGPARTAAASSTRTTAARTTCSTYNGLSMICGPRGEVLAQADAKGEELIIADLPGEPSWNLPGRPPGGPVRPLRVSRSRSGVLLLAVRP